MISRVIQKTSDLSKIQKVDQLEGPLYQLEEAGHTFEITCVNASAALSGTVSARFLRADETTVYFTGSLAGDKVSVTLPQNCYLVNGRFGLVVFVTGGDVTTAVYAVAGNVYRSTSETVIDPTETIPSLEELIAQIEACETATDEAEAAAQVLTVGRDNAYPGYNFTADGVAGYWYTASNTATAETPNDPPTSYPNMKCVSIPVVAGDVFEIATGEVSGSNRMPWAVIGSDRVPIARSGSTGSAVDYRSSPITLKIPTGGVCLLINYDPVAYPGAYIVRAKRQYDIVGASLGVPMASGVSGKAVAESNITNGSLIIANNKLYKTTANISNGSNITPGTNCTETNIVEQLNEAQAALDEITETHASKNVYNAAACGPEDNKAFWNGAESANTSYANTGKIPVTAGTQYIFSAGDIRAKYVEFFSGASGGTFDSRETVNGAAFTVPNGCTYVAIMFFARTHTTEEYNAAIAVAQLEVGSTVTVYEPYGDTRYIPLDAVEDGDALAGLATIPSEQSQINLYDKTLAVNGKYYFVDGTVQTGADYAITGLIPVKPNTTYNLSRAVDSPMTLAGAVLMYGADKSYIGTAALGGYVYSTLSAFTTGATTYYIGVNLYLASHTTQNFTDTINTLMLCYGTMRPLTYSAYNVESVIPAAKLDDAYFERDDFVGKTWLAAGTSITWYDGKAYQAGLTAGALCRGYVGIVTSRKRLNVVNDGISGSTLGNVGTNSFINRYQSLSWSSMDIATLEFGVNDLGNNVPVGTAADAAGTTTFAACLKTVIEYALAQNPKIILILCTEPDVRGANTNTNGNTLKDFSDVTLEIAAQYRLPVCDWYYHSGINALNKGDTTKAWLTVDGTHPSDAGHKRMGAMLIQTMEGLID